MSKIPTKAREAVRTRDNQQCQRCGVRGVEIHHRQRRRAGGHGLANMVLLCSVCHHQWAHANPAAAREAGFIVSAYTEDPSTVPMRTFSGTRMLHDDGSITYL